MKRREKQQMVLMVKTMFSQVMPFFLLLMFISGVAAAEKKSAPKSNRKPNSIRAHLKNRRAKKRNVMANANLSKVSNDGRRYF